MAGVATVVAAVAVAGAAAGTKVLGLDVLLAQDCLVHVIVGLPGSDSNGPGEVVYVLRFLVRESGLDGAH